MQHPSAHPPYRWLLGLLRASRPRALIPAGFGDLAPSGADDTLKPNGPGKSCELPPGPRLWRS
jgi:hypothetical protein